MSLQVVIDGVPAPAGAIKNFAGGRGGKYRKIE